MQTYLVTGVALKTGQPKEKIQRRVRAASGRDAIAKVDASVLKRGKLFLSAQAWSLTKATKPVPDDRAEHTADMHRSADAACGREWVCVCAACRMVRGASK